MYLSPGQILPGIDVHASEGWVWWQWPPKFSEALTTLVSIPMFVEHPEVLKKAIERSHEMRLDPESDFDAEKYKADSKVDEFIKTSTEETDFSPEQITIMRQSIALMFRNSEQVPNMLLEYIRASKEDGSQKRLIADDLKRVIDAYTAYKKDQNLLRECSAERRGS